MFDDAVLLSDFSKKINSIIESIVLIFFLSSCDLFDKRI